MTVKEAAATLECGEKTVRNLIAAGRLAFYRPGLGDHGPIRITPEAVSDYRERRTREASPILSAPLEQHFPPPNARNRDGESQICR